MNRILTTRNKSAPTPGARFLGVQLTVELNSYLALFSGFNSRLVRLVAINLT